MSEGKSLAIYNCQTCMFITKNKKDYERHLQSKKHRVSAFQIPTIVANIDDTAKDVTLHKPPMCLNCHKVYKSRTSVYKHMKKCGISTPTLKIQNETTADLHSESDTHTLPNPESLTPEQIQYILMENKILKELLKKVIPGYID